MMIPLKRIKKQIRKNEVATDNLIKAIEQGQAVDVISAQIEKRQDEKEKLETQFTKEKNIKSTTKCEGHNFLLQKV